MRNPDYPRSRCPVVIAALLGKFGPLEAFKGFPDAAPGVCLVETAACGGGCWRKGGWEQALFPAWLQTKGTLFFQFILELSHL